MQCSTMNMKKYGIIFYDKQDVRHILKINGVIYGAISNETFKINHFWKTIWISIAMYGEFRILLIRKCDEWMYIWKTYLIIFVSFFDLLECSQLQIKAKYSHIDVACIVQYFLFTKWRGRNGYSSLGIA